MCRMEQWDMVANRLFCSSRGTSQIGQRHEDGMTHLGSALGHNGRPDSPAPKADGRAKCFIYRSTWRSFTDTAVEWEGGSIRLTLRERTLETRPWLLRFSVRNAAYLIVSTHLKPGAAKSGCTATGDCAKDLHA